MSREKKWEGFLKEISNLLFFWFFAAIAFTIHRVVFVVMYHEEVGANATFVDYFNAFFTGFRFDCTVIAYLFTLPLACTLILSLFGKFSIIRGVRITLQYVFVILTSLISVVTINYYQEFKEQFNNFLFLGLHDDQEAIAKTIIEYHNPVLNTLILVVAIVVGILIFKHYEKKEFIYSKLKKIKPTVLNIVVVCAVVGVLYVGCFRGNFGSIPTTRKWAATTTDSFLNKTIINPFRSLKYAYSDYKRISSIKGKNPFGEVDLAEMYQADRVSDVIAKKAKGAEIEKPKQVFMIILESYDYWPLMDKYKGLGLTSSLDKIIDKGTLFNNFLPAYHATVFAYTTIVTGTPSFGLNISALSRPGEPYVSSIFTQFKKMGYKTNLFYGGYSSWENIGNFTDYQGCDRIYTGADVGDEMQPGDWGVEDESLFDYVLDTIDEDEYTLNVILMTSNHSPYNVDVYSKGFPYKSLEDIPEEVRQYCQKNVSLLELGHIWYGDWAVGRFMEKAEAKFENALYAFTGDHYGRKSVINTPNLYETSAVPFVLYGQGIPHQKLDTPGGHADIIPTLIELIAPEGFEYYSFGESMFDKSKQLGFGTDKIIDHTTLSENLKEGGAKIIELNTFEEKKSETPIYKKEYDDIMRLTWHYIVKGDSLTVAK